MGVLHGFGLVILDWNRLCDSWMWMAKWGDC
jgi:hypothetical protein